jgi:hypothetical protein
MNNIAITCTLAINLPEKPLLFKITVDDEDIYDISTTETTYDVAFDVFDVFDDNKAEHSIKFILSGKTDNHTEMDANDNVTNSAQIEIKHISISDIDITDLLMDDNTLITYTHDGNGYGKKVTVPFDSVMGYNGVAELKISSPVYLWLLEHM